MTETERQIAHARWEEEQEKLDKLLSDAVAERDRIFFRRQHIRNVCAIVFTFWATFSLWLAWYNNII
jgi:hypothetical protein